MNFRPVLKEVLMTFRICGLDPFEQNLSARFRLGISYLFILIGCIELFLEAIFSSTLHHATDIINAALIWQIMLVKVWTLHSYRAEIKYVIETIQNKFWETNKYGESLNVEIKKVIKLLAVYSIFLIVYYLVAGLSYWINPELIKAKQFPFKFYHVPTNITLTTFLSVATFQLFTATVIGIPSLLCFDVLFAVLIVYNIVELKLIKKGFSELARDGIEDDLTEVKCLVEHHVLILDSIKQINDIFSLFLTNLFISDTFVVCVALLNLINNGFPPEFSDTAMISLYLTMLFTCCMLGMALSEESNSVAEAAYECGWWKKQKIELRKEILLVIQRSQKPTRLIALKLFPLDFDTFKMIMNTAYNVFTVARIVMAKDRIEDTTK